jgi:hypothetical protein
VKYEPFTLSLSKVAPGFDKLSPNGFVTSSGRSNKEGAELVPPPRTHRHRYFGVLAPNSPLRSAVKALAQPAKQVVVQAEPANMSEGTLPIRCG